MHRHQEHHQQKASRTTEGKRPQRFVTLQACTMGMDTGGYTVQYPCSDHYKNRVCLKAGYASLSGGPCDALRQRLRLRLPDPPATSEAAWPKGAAAEVLQLLLLDDLVLFIIL